MSKALVLLSGGTDSTTCLMFAQRDNEAVETVSLVYGQKHEKEIVAAGKIAGHFGLRHDIFQIPATLFEGAESTLVGKQNANPHLTYEEILAGEGPSPTVVPNRNMLLIGYAGAIAATRGDIDLVYFGPHATDAHHNAYPDCTAGFTGAMAAALVIASNGKTQLCNPIQWLTKDEVVIIGLEMGAPMDLTWSCYVGAEKQCGECPTCIERIHAFQASGVKDPVPYAIDVEWGNISSWNYYQAVKTGAVRLRSGV